MRRHSNFFAAILFFLFSILPSVALSQVIDSSFYRWSVYETYDNDLSQKVCYLISRPIKSDTNYTIRDKPYIMIARYKDLRTEEITIFSGYEYKLNSEIYLMINGTEFRLYTKGDKSWAKNRSDDAKIIQNMLVASTAQVRSDAAIGKYAVDEYSLKGITRAYARMRRICY